MHNIDIKRNDVIDYIENEIKDSLKGDLTIYNAKYHHNTSYNNASNVIRYGILTLQDLNKIGLRFDTKEILQTMSDSTSHINGISAVSLSVVGLTDLYKDEMEYDPYLSNVVDFLVSNELKVSRFSTNYGNEYLTSGSIDKKFIKSLDIRILKFIKENYKHINVVIDYYNHLIDMANTIIKCNANIPMREMSNSNNEINKLKLANKSYINKIN